MTAHGTDDVSENGSSPATPQPIPEFGRSVDDEPDSTSAEVCPYPGLASFRRADSQWFFGREQTTNAVIRQLGSRLAGDGPLAVMAPSGAGKSSLLAAGVIPALARGDLPGSQDWPVVDITPGTNPRASLTVRIAERMGAGLPEVTAATADPEQFTAFLVAHAGMRRETRGSVRIVLIVDQFEEVFTECQQESERQSFIAALCAAAQSGTALVLLGMRADFYGSCLQYPALVTSLQSPVALGPMSTDQLRLIITGPAEAENLEIEPGLVELLLRDLGSTYDSSAAAAGYDPGALPLLAHALRATWHERSGRLLTVAGYRRTGGIREAITTTAESAYTRLDPLEQRIAEQLLLRLVNVSDHTRALRCRVPRERLVQALSSSTETSQKILETFGRARLLTLDTTSVEITHEALLWAWPRLAKWINADRAGLRIRQMLSEAAAAWQDEERDPAQLYRGSRLTMAQEWAAGPGCKAPLSELEAAYLQASIDHAQREQHAQQRRTRHLRALIGVLALALVVTLLIGFFAVKLYIRAEKDRINSISRELADASYPVAAAHPEAAMLRAVEASGKTKDPKTLSALLSTQSLYFGGQFSGHKGPVNTAVFSPDGNKLVTTGEDGITRIWNTVDRRLIDELIKDPENPAYDTRFSPDGNFLASITRDGSLQLWDVANRRIIGTIDTLPNASGATSPEATSVAFNRDGLVLAATSAGKAELWDVASRRRITRLPGEITKIIFNPVNHTAAMVDLRGKVHLVSLSDPANPTLLSDLPPPSFVSSVVFSPDGNTLVTATSDQTAILWNVRDPSNPRIQEVPLMGHTLPIESMAFSPDGTMLVTGGGDGTARLWSVDTRKTIAVFGGQNGPAVNAVSFNRDGHTVVTAHNDGVARLWDKHGPILTPSPPVVDLNSKIEFSPRGDFLAVYGADGLRLWDMADRSQITELRGNVSDLTFSEDGLMLIIAKTNEGVILWDTNKRGRIFTLPVNVTNFGKVKLSSDGKTLAIIDGKSLQLWNVDKPDNPVVLDRHLRPPVKNLFGKMEFSSSGRILAVATLDGVISLLDMGKPGEPEFLRGSLKGDPGGFIDKMSFSRDDRTLIVARGKEGILERWDVGEGRLLSNSIIPSGSRGVYSDPVGLSSDGTKLASVDEDTTKIKLWDLSEDNPRNPVVTLTGHAGPVIDADFSRNSSDNGLLATLSQDGTVRIWDLDPIRVAGQLCSIIGPVSDEERKNLLPIQFSSEPAC